MDKFKQATSAVANKIKKRIKKAVISALLPAILVIVKIMAATIIITMLVSFVFTAFSWLVEIFSGKNNPEEFYKLTEITDVMELVKVAGSDREGYYYEFVDDIDKKLDAYIQKTILENGEHNITGINKLLWKKMLKAELMTELPDLGGAPRNAESSKKSIDDILKEMSLEDKIAQMLFVIVQAEGSSTKFDSVKVGGYVINGTSGFEGVEDAISSDKASYSESEVVPFYASDDEGGTVNRFLSGEECAATGQSEFDTSDTANIENVYKQRGEKLKEKGINLVLAPVADTVADKDANGNRPAMRDRSFGSDENVVTSCVVAAVKGLKEGGMASTLKHYPGFGEAENTDFVEDVKGGEKKTKPFIEGVKGNEKNTVIMVNHLKYDDIPASLSEQIHQELRGEVGNDVLVITDDMGGAAAVKNIENKVVKAIKAGNDMVMISQTEFKNEVDNVVQAVNSGELKEEDITNCVRRILVFKEANNIIDTGTTDSSEDNTNKEKKYQKNEEGEKQAEQDLINEIQTNITLGKIKITAQESTILTSVQKKDSLTSQQSILPENNATTNFNALSDAGNKKVLKQLIEGYGKKIFKRAYDDVENGTLKVTVNTNGKIIDKEYFKLLLNVHTELEGNEYGTLFIDEKEDNENNSSGGTTVSGGANSSSKNGGYIWPVSTQTDAATRAINITSVVGHRDSPGGIGSTEHGGMDIACPTGTPIVATADGIVVIAGVNGGYGNCVKIDHGTVNGMNLTSLYGHNSQILVTTGQTVSQGDVIAYAGSTGWSTGPHCHFEIRLDGEIYDPLNLFTADYVSGPTSADNIGNGVVSGYGLLGGVSGASGKKRTYGENQFQGAIKLRRVTPDATSGLDQVPQGETTAIGGEEINSDDTDVSFLEEYVKQWTEGTTFVVKKTADLYEEKSDGELVRQKEGIFKTKKIDQGSEGTYTGKYKVKTNIINKDNSTIYIEVDFGEKKGFVKTTNLQEKKITTSSSIKVSKIENALSQNNSKKEEKETFGTGARYKIAISAGGNPENKEEVKRIVKVAKKLEELLKDSKITNNLEIIQTGNTDSESFSEEIRAQKAKEAKPDVCVEIEVSSADDVEAIFKENDGFSQEFAEYLAKDVSDKLGTENKEAGTDVEKLGGQTNVINNYTFTKFPSAIIKASTVDRLNYDDVVENYATGIKEAIKQYLDSDHEGYKSSAERGRKTTSSIKSTVKNLQYIKKEDFDKKTGTAAAGYFTFDDVDNLKSAKVITSSWNGSMKNSGIFLREAFKKYTTPFEFFMYLFIDLDNKNFAEALADEAIGNSEIIVALQDNLTFYNSATNATGATSVDTTYAKTWFVEAMKESNYSSVALEMGTQNSIKTILQGKADYSRIEDSDGNVTETVTCKYDTGETMTRGREDIFANLYKKYNLAETLRPQWFIQIVEQNQKTTHLTKLMKYLLSEVTGMDFGVDWNGFKEEYDLQHFDNINNMSGGVIQGSDLQETVWFTLRAFGLNEFQVAGIMGNISQESDWNVNAMQTGTDTSGGIGLCQWDDRKDSLKAYAASKGTTWQDLATQLEFLMGELTPGGGAGGYATYQMASYQNEWANATDPGTAAEAFCWGWERPSSLYANLEKRKNEAQKFYDLYHGKEPPTANAVYYQNDSVNGQVFFNSTGTYKFDNHGCGPTAMAMCVSDLLNQRITPADAWSWTNYRYDDGGAVSWAYFEAAASNYGLQFQDLGNSASRAVQALREGKKVISSQGPRYFARGSGHIVYFYAIDGNGGISVKDPNMYNVTERGYDTRKFTEEEIGANSFHFWAFWK